MAKSEKENETDIVKEAAERWKTCADWESHARRLFIEDVKFAEGDSDNAYQWPASYKQNRDLNHRPCLTMNIVRQHNLQIVNSSKQSKNSIKIRAIGNGATKKSADLYGAIVRQIEYRSNAQDAGYKIAQEFQVKGGLGWWRIITDYVAPDSFDQEILIDPVNDPLSVFIDPDCKMPDKSDARFGLIFNLVSKDLFEATFPDLENVPLEQPLGVGVTDESEIKERNSVRVCEYFRIVSKPDTLISFIDPTDQKRKNILKSKLAKNIIDGVMDSELTKTRPTAVQTVEWYLIVGQKIIDHTTWPGKFIPLVPVIGEETVINGILDRKGHTRTMKDAQRMYNYNASAQVEFVALQSKTPYIASAKAIEDYEVMWAHANTSNAAVLIYNDTDPDTKAPIEAPKRQNPPVSSPGFQDGMQTAFNQMMMTSGQWQNQMGMGGNERTGAAIQRRQHQSETSTFHFQDNYAAALKYSGRQIIDLIPKIYDTERLMKLMNENGEEMDVKIDPSAKQALQEEIDEHGQVVARVLNPKIGEYDVAADVGAAYATRRQETAEALTLILTQAPNLTALVGDLLMRSMDFPEADEAASRMYNMVPPQALGKGPSQVERKAMQQLQSTRDALAESLQKYGEAKVKLDGKAQMRDIDVYEARTKRIQALAGVLPKDPEVLRKLLIELMSETSGETLKPIIEANLAAASAESQEGKVLSGSDTGENEDETENSALS